MTPNQRLIAIGFITALGFQSLLWLQLRFIFHRDIEPSRSMRAQMFMHGFQAAMLLLIGLFSGDDPIIHWPPKTIRLLPVVAGAYFVVNVISYYFKVKEYNGIIDSRNRVRIQRMIRLAKEKENDAKITE